MPDDLLQKKLDLIAQYESGNRNVYNDKYGTFTPEGLAQTANGYWQITDTNWHKIAPQVGIDTKARPQAISTTRDEQQKVAEYLLTKSGGIKNWKVYQDNPKFRAEWAKLGGEMPQQDEPSQGIDLSSRDKILALIKAHPEAYPNLYKQYFPETTKGNQPTGPVGRWAVDTSDLKTPWANPLGITGGVKQMLRAAMNLRPEGGEYKPQTRAADFGEGALRAFGTPLAIGGTAMELGAPLLAGEGLAGLGAGALNVARSGLLGAGGAFTGGVLAGGATSDPDIERLGQQVGGVSGALFGDKLPVGKIAEATIGRLIPKSVRGLIKLGSMMGEEAPQPTPKEPVAPKTAPTGKVNPPKTFQDPVYDKLAAEGHLPLDKYEAHLRSNGVPEEIIQAKMAKAAKAIAEEAAKNAPPPVTLKPQPPPNPPPTPPQGFLPGMEPPGPVTPSMPPTNVTLPPTVQAVRANGQPMGRQLQLPINGGPPEQLPLPGTNVLQPNAPQPPLGGPVQQSLPFPEPPRAAPPYQPELPFNARPQDPNQMQLPFDAQRTPVRPPTLQLPGQGPGPALPTVRAPGSEVNPANIQRQLPFGRGAIRQDMPTEQHAAKIADLAAEFRRAPPKPTNRMSILRWLKRLDFIPSEQEWIRGKEIYQSRKVGEGARSRMP